MAARLQDVSEQLAAREDELRGRLNMNELQLKEQIVYNVSLGWQRLGLLVGPAATTVHRRT